MQTIDNPSKSKLKVLKVLIRWRIMNRHYATEVRCIYGRGLHRYWTWVQRLEAQPAVAGWWIHFKSKNNLFSLNFSNLDLTTTNLVCSDAQLVGCGGMGTQLGGIALNRCNWCAVSLLPSENNRQSSIGIAIGIGRYLKASIGYRQYRQKAVSVHL